MNRIMTSEFYEYIVDGIANHFDSRGGTNSSDREFEEPLQNDRRKS
jgi:hypothetical protein